MDVGKGTGRQVRELVSGYSNRGRDVTIDNLIIPAPGLPVKRQGAILENCHGFVPFALISKPLLPRGRFTAVSIHGRRPAFAPQSRSDCGAYFCQNPLYEANFVRIGQTLQQYSIFTKYQ